MQLVRRLRLPAFFCALAVLLCELIGHASANMGISDDGPYIVMAQRLANTGHFAYDGWAATMIGWQLYFGAFFIKIFGSSFTAARMSTLLVAIVLAFVLQRTFVLAGINEHNATTRNTRPRFDPALPDAVGHVHERHLWSFRHRGLSLWVPPSAFGLHPSRHHRVALLRRRNQRNIGHRPADSLAWHAGHGPLSPLAAPSTTPRISCRIGSHHRRCALHSCLPTVAQGSALRRRGAPDPRELFHFPRFVDAHLCLRGYFFFFYLQSWFCSFLNFSSSAPAPSFCSLCSSWPTAFWPSTRVTFVAAFRLSPSSAYGGTLLEYFSFRS